MTGDTLRSSVRSSEANRQRPLSRDLAFDILKNRRRRYVIGYLREADGQVQLSDLAEQVAAWENDVTVDEVPDVERKKVYTALYQSHLPKLDDCGLAEYDQNSGLVETNPEMQSELEAHLREPWGDLGESPLFPRPSEQFRWTGAVVTLLVLDAWVLAFVQAEPLATLARAGVPVLTLALVVSLLVARRRA